MLYFSQFPHRQVSDDRLLKSIYSKDMRFCVKLYFYCDYVILSLCDILGIDYIGHVFAWERIW